MSIFIYVCITRFGLDVCECVCCVCFSLKIFEPAENLVKTFCKN